MSWQLNLMGRLELLDDHGRSMPLTSKNAFLILAYVATSGSALRDEVAEIVWPAASPKSARDSLRNALAVLRRILPSDVLRADTRSITLRNLACDWLALSKEEDYSGDFMPGLEQDWVIETRLQLRTHASAMALEGADRALESEDRCAALRLVERACQVDPWNEEAAQIRVQLLDELGRREEAFATADSFRAKTLRQLGTLTDLRPSALPEENHPLLTAGEWLLDRSPAEALSMLAATQNHWLTMPVDAAIDFHRRALAANPGDSSDRRMVHAQFVYISATAGRDATAPEDAVKALDSAIQAGEHAIVARLAGALAYRRLSAGNFAECLRLGTLALAHARQTRNRDLIMEFELEFVVLLQHSGHEEESLALYHPLSRRVMESGQEVHIASHLLFTLEPLMEEGKHAKAAENLARARTIFEAQGAARMIHWGYVGEASLHQGMGDFVKEREALMQVRRLGPRIGGQAVAAMADDRLAATNCRLGEYDSAAESLASSVAFRRTRGSVPSMVERTLIRSTLAKIREKLDAKDLRRAMARAEANEPSGTV